jgi:hypothetical protein
MVDALKNLLIMVEVNHVIVVVKNLKGTTRVEEDN